MEDYYSKPPIVLYGATVCDTPMGVSQSGNPIATSTKDEGHRARKKTTTILSRRALSDLPSAFAPVRSSHLPAVGAGKHPCAPLLFQLDLI
jgi:hypothetical protein